MPQKKKNSNQKPKPIELWKDKKNLSPNPKAFKKGFIKLGGTSGSQLRRIYMETMAFYKAIKNNDSSDYFQYRRALLAARVFYSKKRGLLREPLATSLITTLNTLQDAEDLQLFLRLLEVIIAYAK